MKNRITVFTFKRSNEKEAYDESLMIKRKDKIANLRLKLKVQETNLEKLLEFQGLSEAELKEYKSFKNDLKTHSKVMIEVFSDYIENNISARKTGYPIKRSADILLPSIGTIEKNIKALYNSERIYFILHNKDSLSSSTPIERLQKSFIEKLSEKLGETYDLSKMFGIKEQYLSEAQNLKGKIEESKKFIAQFENQERIELKDLEDVNQEIELMNQKGWQVKQIENIQSGKSRLISDAGMGYSFTTGILILWEKED